MNAETTQSRSSASLSFRGRIFLAMLLLLAIMQAFTAWVVYNASHDNIEAGIQQQLSVGRKVFTSELQNRRLYLNGAVNTISQDWGFREVAGKQDRLSTNSVLDNHRRRINADIGIYSNRSGDLFASTEHLPTTLQDRLKDYLLDTYLANADKDDSEQMILLDGRLYQFVRNAVNAPLPIGSVGMGFVIDDQLANRFKAITGVEISFVLADTERLDIVASTLPGNARDLAVRQSGHIRDAGEQAYYVDSAGKTLQLSFALDRVDDQQIYVLLQQSTIESLERFNKWWINLTLLFFIALGVAAVVAALIARSVTDPVHGLLNVVRRITSGQYNETIPVQRQDEIGELASEFQNMQHAIATREEEIRFRADHDQLTGLINRSHFLENLQLAIKEKPDSLFAVVLINIDRFKDVNDTLGHNIGDQLLRYVAGRLCNRFSEHGLARLGADRFALYEAMPDYSELQNLSLNVNQVFDEPFAENGINIRLHVTQGLALYPNHSHDALTLLRLAEVAMYTAREKHQMSAIYDKQQDRYSVMRLTLISELPNAIRNGELCLHYQPVLSFQADGNVKIAKTECLVRWIHPVHGFIPPDEFIHLAEQSGAITELTSWVLDAALAQCQQWYQDGWKIGVAVNISAVDLFRGDLLQVVPTLLKRYQVPPSLLTLEVTESELMQDPDHSTSILNTLRSLNVRLSIDDYGTGYSSLAQLKQLPINELKIDKSFVIDLIGNAEDRLIVRSTIELGHTMGLQVVAEGVESEAALEQLQADGCNYVQGYFISKPLPIDELELWLTNTAFYIEQPQPQDSHS